MVVSFKHSTLEALVEDNFEYILKLAGCSVSGVLQNIKTEFTEAKPAVSRADVVYLVGDPPTRSVVVEVQLGKDLDKPGAWTRYIAHLYDLYGCPVEIIVLTHDLQVEAWAREPIQITPEVSWTPTVLGPSNVPKVVSAEDLKGRPKVGLLHALVHCNQPDAEPIFTATYQELKAAWKGGQIGEYEFEMNFDTLVTIATDAWRQRLMETDMEATSFFQQLRAEGREEGIEQGIEQGIRDAIVRVCHARKVELSAADLQKLQDCHNHEVLSQWLERSVFAESTDSIFTP